MIGSRRKQKREGRIEGEMQRRLNLSKMNSCPCAESLTSRQMVQPHAPAFLQFPPAVTEHLKNPFWIRSDACVCRFRTSSDTS